MHESKWSTEKKYEVVLRSLRGEPVADICRENGVSPTLFYRWRDDFLRGAQSGLKDKRSPQNRDPVIEENRKLKKIVAEQQLVIEGQKQLFPFDRG